MPSAKVLNVDNDFVSHTWGENFTVTVGLFREVKFFNNFFLITNSNESETKIHIAITNKNTIPVRYCCLYCVDGSYIRPGYPQTIYRPEGTTLCECRGCSDASLQRPLTKQEIIAH